ncbi:unnamed protein product [Boreogadus saida]
MPCVHGLLTPVQLRTSTPSAASSSHCEFGVGSRTNSLPPPPQWTRQCHSGASILVIESRAGSELCSVYGGALGPSLFPGSVDHTTSSPIDLHEASGRRRRSAL